MDYLKIADESGGVPHKTLKHLRVMGRANFARFAERVRGVPDWQQIETAPKDGTHVWAFADGEQIAMHWIDISGGCWVYSDSLLGDVCPDAPQPTHWMPLPAAPGAAPCPPAVSEQAAEIERLNQHLRDGIYQLGNERKRALAAEQERDGLREALLKAVERMEFEDIAPITCEEIRAALAAHPKAEPLTAAARDVLAERKRQISVEGWTPEHDDNHGRGTLAEAGACYAMAFGNQPMPMDWPWGVNWWKPKDRRSNLVRAGALILAEIERFDRAAAKATKEPK